MLMENEFAEIAENLDGGKLLIFKRNEIYQARIYIGSRKYLYKTLGTKDFPTAKVKAVKLYFEVNFKKQEGLPIQVKTLNDVIAEYVTNREIDYERNKGIANTSRRQTTSIYMLRQIKRVVKFWQEYCGTTQITKIDNIKLSEYVIWRKNYYHVKQSNNELIHQNAKVNPADKTIEWEIGLARTILKYAQEKAYRGNITFPTYRFKAQKKIVRPTFTNDEYWKLIWAMRKRISEEKSKERKYTKELLRDYVLILANSGIRVGEANNLQESDIESFLDENGTKNYMFYVRGKTGKRIVIPRNSCVRYVDRLLARNKLRREEEATNGIRKVRSPNRKIQDRGDWLFCMYDGNKIITLIDQFKDLLKSVNLTKNRYGEFYTLYSLRHFYAVRMMKKGIVSIFDVARNMGTSVEIIQNYYLKDATPLELATRLGGGSRRNKVTN